MKLKMGDKAKITARRAGHGFEIGEIVEIIHVDECVRNYVAKNDKCKSWSVVEQEVELFINKKEMETILINVPEGKEAKQENKCNSIVITFVDKKSKWEDYVNLYKQTLTGKLFTNEFIKVANFAPPLWPVEYKYGLLKFIADDLNGGWCADWCDTRQSKWQLYVDTVSNTLNRFGQQTCKHATPTFSEGAIEKAKQIVPIEFIKSF